MPDALAAVARFHRTFRAPVLDAPTIPGPERCALRVSLLAEELDELKAAIAADDLVEVADALCDLQYVLSGAVLEFGLGDRFKALFDEVQRSNMSKVCTTRAIAEATQAYYRQKSGVGSSIHEIEGGFLVLREPDHKVLKSVAYSPAALAPLLKTRPLD